MQQQALFAGTLCFIGITVLVLLLPTAKSNRHERFEVTVTTNIIADAVREIAGDCITVNCLMQPGVDPHSYHARLSDLRALLNADLVLYNGLHLEGKMAHILRKLDSIKPTYPVSDALSCDDLIASPEFAHLHDPHIWFDISLWQKVVSFIAELLTKHDPQNSYYYLQNRQRYLAALDRLEDAVREQLAHIPQKRRFLVTSHDAFSYFGRAYGLTVIGLQGVNLDAEPCIKNMQELTTFICSHEIPTLFVESSLPKRSIEAIAQAVAARGKTVCIGDELYSDTLGASEEPAGTYIGMLMHNTNGLVKGLG